MSEVKGSAAIAATGNEWQRPGVLVADSKTGTQWRCVYNDGVEASWISYRLSQTHYSCLVIDGFCSMPACSRAIAEGPVMQDDATWGVLLGLLPGHVLDRDPDGWLVWKAPDWAASATFPNRGLSVEHAYLASKGD